MENSNTDFKSPILQNNNNNNSNSSLEGLQTKSIVYRPKEETATLEGRPVSRTPSRKLHITFLAICVIAFAVFKFYHQPVEAVAMDSQQLLMISATLILTTTLSFFMYLRIIKRRPEESSLPSKEDKTQSSQATTGEKLSSISKTDEGTTKTLKLPPLSEEESKATSKKEIPIVKEPEDDFAEEEELDDEEDLSGKANLNEHQLPTNNPDVKKLNETVRSALIKLKSDILYSPEIKTNPVLMEQSMGRNKEKIFGPVYIGNFSALEELYTGKYDLAGEFKKENEQEIKFKSVITVTPKTLKDYDIATTKPPGVEKHFKIDPDDDAKAWDKISPNLDEMFTMIDVAILNKKEILVHCSQGQSRSGSVVIAYLINRCGVTYEQAFNFVRKGRHLVEPTPSLMGELREYADICKTMN